MDHLRLSHADDEIIIVVEAAAEEPVVMPQGDRPSVAAYNKSDAQGGVSSYRPKFLIQDTQRVRVKTWGESSTSRLATGQYHPCAVSGRAGATATGLLAASLPG
jgi:hypothetical protein